MKHVRRPKKDRPPERDRRAAPRHRRFESSFATAMVFTVLVLWGLGGRVQSEFVVAMETVTPPAGSFGLGALIIIAGLIGLNAVLIAAETAAEALRPAHVKVLREKDAKRADRLQVLLDAQDRVAAACSVASQLVRLAIVLCTFLMAPALLDWAGVTFGWANNYANYLICAVALLVPTALIHLVVSELLPKSYATVNPARVGTRLHRFSMGVSVVFGLPASAINALQRSFVERFGAQSGEPAANLAEEEIKTIAEEGHETGEIEVGEREMLHSVFEFTDTVAREVMTPRVDVDAMPVKCDPTEVARVIQESGHSRIPLYEDTDDQIVGIIHAKDLFGALLNGKAPNLRSLMRPPLFVSENKSLHELLSEMRASRSQMAIVQDEFGGTAGVVTIEDIVEELVGDIVDEYDVEEPEIVEAPGGWLVDGKTRLDDLNEAAKTRLESEEFDTLGGYVFGLFGRVPKPGESIEGDGLSFTVADADGRRILRIKVETAPDTAAVGLNEIDA